MRSGALAMLTALLVCPAATADLHLGGFAVDLPGSQGDDAFEVWNAGTEPASLDDVTVSDGEGVLAFPPGQVLGPGQRIRVAQNATAYREAARAWPDFAAEGTATQGTLEVRDAGFRLADEADSLSLARQGILLDAVVWGDSPTDAPGWVGPPLELKGGVFLRWVPRAPGPDTDSRLDWEAPKWPRLGWRVPQTAAFHILGSAIAYTAPDRSREVVTSAFLRAERSLRLNVYEFRDVGLARLLLDQMETHPRLRVEVLVDRQPVGLEAEERLVGDRILQSLQDAGAEVRLLRHDRYGYDHAKYAVVDDRWVWVQSENLVSSGIPIDGRTGNRGWGLLVDDPALAQAVADLFDHDFAWDAYGAQPFVASAQAKGPLPVPATARARPVLATAEATELNVTLVVGPEPNLETSDPLLELLASARQELLVEQLRVPPQWKDGAGHAWPNAYADALVAAAERGVRVRVLLDGHFDPEGPNGNAETVTALNRNASRLPLEARIQGDAAAPVLHVKGVVADRRVAWVGSMNWNLASVAQNREVSLRVEAPELAALFVQAFDADWQAAAPEQTGAGLGGIEAAATIITLAALVWVRFRPRPP